jgi:hypothetical protein
MALDNQSMYSIYVAGLAKAAGLPSMPPNMILAGNSMPANLAIASTALSPVPSTPEALGQIYQLADTELFPQGVYDPTTNSFFKAYATYIDNLAPANSQKAPTPTQQGNINLLKSQLGKATAQYNTDLSSAFTAYQQAQNMFPGKYSNFQNYLAQTNYGATINTDKSLMDGCNSQLSTLYTAIYGDDYVAIQLAKTTVDNVRTATLGTSMSTPGTMQIQDGAGSMLIVPAYSPGSLSEFSTWVDSTIQQHGNTGEKAVTIGFSTSSAMADFSKSTYFSHTDWSTNFFFFSVGGGSTTSSSQVNINTASSQFNMRMGFDAITTLSLEAGAWYDSSLMSSFDNSQGMIRPTALLIAMYPSISLTMDATSYAQARSAYNSSSGFGVGAFWCAAGGHQTSSSTYSMQSQWDDASNSVTMTSESTTPVVVGMLVAPLKG